MSESATPETGALTVEQAVASLEAPRPAEEQAPQAQETPEPEENTEGEASSPEEAEDVAESPAEEPETDAEPEAVAPAEPPKYWSKDAKEAFANLPPELQAVVLQQEGPREEAAAKAKAEAAEVSQRAQAELGKVQQLAEALADRLPQWVSNFQARWGAETPDWIAYAREHGADAAFVAKTQFENERQQLAEAAQAQQVAEAQARQAFVQTEFTKLAEIAPHLADPVAGPEKRKAVSEYLVKTGIPTDALQNISAIEMALAEKAMLWDQAQAKAKAAPKPAPKPAPQTKPLARGAATAGSADPRTKAANRYAQTRSVDDAVALLLAGKA